MTSPSRIQQLWELFVQAEHSSYEKQGWLDIFLAEFLVQVKEGKSVEEILSFCAPGGVATLIGCELLSDVHKICSLPGDGEDLSLLRKHFLQGRGWRSLATLQCLGVRNLSCGRELASLLISLYPVCLQKLGPEQKENMTLENPFILLSKDSGSLDDIPRIRTPPKMKLMRTVQQGLCPPIRAELMRSHSNTSTKTNRSGRRTRTPVKGNASPIVTLGGASGDTTGATSDSEHCLGTENQLEQLNKSSTTLRIWLDPMDFDYFTSVVRSEDEARLDRPDYTPSRRRPHGGRGDRILDSRRSLSPGDFEDSRTKEVLSAEIHCYEFFRLVIDLLRSLCGTELNGISPVTANSGQHISLQAVNFALENLCTLQFGGNTNINLVTAQIAELKAAMTRLLLTALEKILLHPEATTAAIRNGMLPVMLKILEDAVRKLDAVVPESHEQLVQEFVFGTAYGVLMFLYCLLLQRSTVDKFQDFLQLFQLFSESHGGRLIEKTVMALLALPNVELQLSMSRAKKVIDLIGQLVTALKKVRGEIVHSHDCRRARHKRCVNQASGALHHHYDLLGGPFSPTLVGPRQPTCCVASLFMVLVRILTSSSPTINIRPHVLRTLTLCGTCCCFPARSVIGPLIDLFKNGSNGKVRALGFALLERTIYSELGAISQHESTVSCVFCSGNFAPKSVLTSEYSAEESLFENVWKKTERRLSETDMEKTDEAETPARSSWECLELYRDLVQSPDTKLSHTTTSHLLKVAPRCTPAIKHRLLFKVFYPTFITAKTCWFNPSSSSEEMSNAKFNILSCLSAFSSILSGNVMFVEEFVTQYEGLNHILELISLPAFSKLCCSILEVTAIVEIWKLEYENGDVDDDVGKLPSLCMLQGAVQSATTRVLSLLGVAISEDDELEQTVCDEEDEETTVHDSESHMQLLATVCVFWRTCANLVLYSPQYRKHLAQNPLARDGLKLLQVLLDRVTSKQPGMRMADSHSESHLCMKVIESTLIVILTAPPVVDDSGVPVSNESVVECLQRALLSVDVDRSVNMRQLCDVLLRCAVAHSCHEQMLPPNKKPKLPSLLAGVGGGAAWDECVSEGEDEDEAEAGDGSEGGSEAYVTADEGYEADVEVLDSCGVSGAGGATSCVGGDIEDESSSSIATTAVATPIPAVMRVPHSIAHPALCLLAVELLVHLNKRYYEMSSGILTSCPERPNESTHLQSLVHCIQRLVALCRDNQQNCVVLANSDLSSKLLKGFAAILSVSETKFGELQRIILELVILLARHNIRPKELAQYLNFFKSENPPLGPLLTALTSLVTCSHAQPNYILCFPAAAESFDPVANNRRSGSNSPTPDSPTGDNNAAGSLARTLRSQHIRAGIKSCWSRCALALPLNSDLGWSMWLQGFSLSLWLRLDHGGGSSVSSLPRAASFSTASDSSSDWGVISDTWTTKDNTYHGAVGGASLTKTPANETSLHIFSIGYETLMLEAWADTNVGTLTLKLTRPDSRACEMLSEATVEGVLCIGQWHHLAANVRDYMHARKTVIEVGLIVDGWQETKVLLPFNGLLVRKTRATCLLLGHSTSVVDAESLSGAWFLGSVMVFRSPVFTKDRAVYLVGLGPNYTNLTDCSDIDKLSPNFTSVFGPKTLYCGIDWDAVLDGKKGNLKELQDNLLLIYCAQNPNVVNVYPQVVTNPGGVVGSLFPGQPGFRVVTLDQRASQQLPLSLYPTLLVPLNPRRYQGLVAAASILGGTPVFLFLFARVVELKASQELQARALFLLLRLVQSDSELFSQFVSQDCHKLLLKVLQSSRCIAGHHMLKAVLDTCCDKPVLQYQPGPRRFHIAARSDAVIVNSFLLTTIVGSWRDWERAASKEKDCAFDEEGGGVLGTLFRTLHVLLRDDHPFREFNAAQLNRVRMVEALLLFCKERFLYEETLQLHMSVCCSLVELIRSLMGSPPEFSHIVAVTDFLVLLHRASATYITHVRNSFYFLLSPTPPSNPLNLSGTNSAPSTKPGPSPRPTLRGKPGDNDAKSKSARKGTRDAKDMDFAQPVDPQKLNKALTNLQIKQNSLDGGNVDPPLTSENLQNMVERVSSLPVDSNRAADNDSGIAGSYRETSSDIAASMDVHRKTGNYTDSADKLLACAEQATFFSTSLDREVECGLGSEEEKEKFTTETGMKEPAVSPWCDTDLADDPQELLKDAEPHLAVGEGEKGLVVEGLLLLLRDTLLILPDNMAHQVLNHVVKAEFLLVMANHSDSRVRMAVVKVLSAYLHRSTDEEINKFLKLKGFHQLANQLNLFPASLELVEACVSLVTRCNVRLEEQTEVPTLSEMSFLQLNSFPPLLALLPRAVHDVSLAHNMIVFLRDMFAKVTESIRPMLDCGLLEVLSRTLVAVAHLAPQPTDMYGMSEQDILFGDIHVFLVTLSAHVLHTPGTHHMQILNDMQLQLSYMEKLERNTCGPQARCVSALREAHCVLLEGQLDVIQDMITFLQQPTATKLLNTTSFLTAVLTTSYDAEQTLGANLEMRGFTNSGSNPGSPGFQNCKPGNGNSSINTVREVPRGEINERFKTVIVKSVDFLVNGEHSTSGCGVEHNYARRLLATLLQGLASVLEKRATGQRSAWSAVMWAARDLLRVQAAHLLVWMLSPVQPVKIRTFAVHTVRSEARCKELLSSILHTHAQTEQKFTVFLWDLLHRSAGHMSGTDLRACQDFSHLLQSWGLANLTPGDLWEDELKVLVADMEKQHQQYEKQNEGATHRSVFKFEGLMKNVAEAAMSITRTVVDAQNSERKVFMEHIKQAYSENVQIRIKWQKVIQQLTHERAVWFFPDSYPRSWQLDATEGPARVRNRLQRCHLSIGRKYLMPAAQRKLDAVKGPDPLSYLFEQDKKSSTSSVLIERLHTNEKIQHMCAAKVITPANEVPGELLIGESCLYFVADDSMLETDLAEVTAGSLDVSSTAWPFENVKEIHNRRFQLQERALEIFLLNGKTYLVAFQSSKERDAFAWELTQCQLPNRVAGDNLSDAVQLWREGLLTNWEYLTQLNKMAGRSYNDLMQYPVFPFVLANYTGQTLDLTDPQAYRNFKKPMAVQDKKNEQHYINNYNYLKQELMEGIHGVTLNKEPYHYGSHYSNSGTVLHFLVRLPPFTGMFLTYQDQNFDLPDRTFHSLHTTWRLTSSDSTTDVKELIPEFFFLPEFLRNSEEFNFGVRQSGDRVNDVELPPWSHGDARRFVLIHRQALESVHARENLPLWIDLVFGYKQTGKAAVEAINVFHPATYCGFDVEKIRDPLERTAWKTMVRTYGQTPRQLFRSAHPMVVQSLASRTPSSSVREVVPGVKGLLWGSYVGSPADSEPVVVWKHQHRTPVASLVPLLTNDVFGLAPHTSILLRYSKEKGLSMVNATSVLGAALVTWGHADGVVRVKLKKEQPPWPVVKSPGLDPICTCASVPDCSQLWMGHWSGKLVVYEYKFSPSRGHLEFHSEPVTLLGHDGPIHNIYICRSFSIVVTGSQDGSAIIWDLNNLSYVRCISGNNMTMPVNLVSVSETLGDIAMVSSAGASSMETTLGGSLLRLHTINAVPIGTVATRDSITAICFSGAPEGVSVNVIAAGLASGAIRLWSTWDLSPVREITTSFIARPIISLTYSQDAQHLYASADDGSVVIWEGGGGSGVKGVSKTPKFLNLTSL
ncbi:lysosomal-trafficking regulator isoform X2 [Periplaneta americana]|uniref:lysosomal-trafficking regulator isoform X2 n=1 Tax=Periplaneta americana TaxID=6978 RepID=UPI0037E98228